MSLFDGMSCGRLALERAGLPVTTYWASEIDKYAIKIAQKNYPDTIHIGDIENIPDGKSYPQMDLLLGGSPCQGFSFAGKGLNFDDPRSKLFWRYVWFLKENNPRYFLLENVRMNQRSQDVISRALGVEPIAINSSLVSAQNRYRLYWTNIPFDMPKDKDIKLKDILEDGCVDRDKSHCLDANYFKGGNLKSYFEKHRRQLVFSDDGLCHVGDADLKGHGYNRRVYHPEGKAPSLCASSGGNLEPKTITSDTTWRKLTVTECERLQTVPEGYTEGVSNTQRYKMLGNGWTVDVIAHILQGIA
jgi:DNA-cytosine methyltransferase